LIQHAVAVEDDEFHKWLQVAPGYLLPASITDVVYEASVIKPCHRHSY